MLVHQSNNDPKQELEFFNRLKSKLIDGLILGSCVSPLHILDEVSDFGKIVSCEASEYKQIASVFINHESGIQMAIDHLREVNINILLCKITVYKSNGLTKAVRT